MGAGLRPFGVSFLFAGWDRHHGFQLYESDPAGTFGGWAATAIGANFQVREEGSRRSQGRWGWTGALDVTSLSQGQNPDPSLPNVKRRRLSLDETSEGPSLQLQ